MKKRILVYGDSNTWGESAFDGGRIVDKKQWPNILQQLLGQDYWVVQAGLGGRTAGDMEDVANPHYNGRASYEVTFRSAQTIADDLLRYKTETQRLIKYNEARIPKLIYVLPPNFKNTSGYYEADESKRSELNQMMQQIKDHMIIVFDDLEMSADGVHISENSHERVAKKVKETIDEI